MHHRTRTRTGLVYMICQKKKKKKHLQLPHFTSKSSKWDDWANAHWLGEKKIAFMDFYIECQWPTNKFRFFLLPFEHFTPFRKACIEQMHLSRICLNARSANHSNIFCEFVPLLLLLSLLSFKCLHCCVIFRHWHVYCLAYPCKIVDIFFAAQQNPFETLYKTAMFSFRWNIFFFLCRQQSTFSHSPRFTFHNQSSWMLAVYIYIYIWVCGIYLELLFA